MSKRKKDKALDSYLSTTELLEIAGITRKALRVYERDGACAPALVKSDYYKYWTLDQANSIRKIGELSQSGMPMKEIAAAASSSEEELLELSYQTAVDQGRKNRRYLKSLWMQKLAFNARKRPVDYDDGWYLRYLPQRWFALAPLWPHAAELAEPESFMGAYRRLSQIADIVGWADSPLTGQVVSIGRQGQGSGYVYLQLASAPMPAPSGWRPADSGCYLSTSAETGSPLCTARHCSECALFGRKPSDEERFAWERFEEEYRKNGIDIQDRTVMASGLREAYLSGAWSIYTKHRLGWDPSSYRPGIHGPTLRPRLMPHEQALPYGVTACVLPQGIYLCHTCKSADAPDELARAKSLAENLEASEITGEQERSAVQKAMRKQQGPETSERIGFGFDRNDPAATAEAPIQRGFSREPSATMLSEHETDLRNWHKQLEEDELSHLKLKTNAALCPEDGYLIVANRLMGEPVDPHGKFELQILVEASDLESIEKREE